MLRQCDDAAGTRRRKRCVFTILQNEPVFLPLWLAHYRRSFAAEDMYVLDHDSTDGCTRGLGGACHVVPVHRAVSFDHVWLKNTVQAFQAFLLQSYDTVLFVEIDELVVADPARFPDLGAYIDAFPGPAARCSAYNVIQHPEEAPLQFDRPILPQRRFWHGAHRHAKCLLARVPLTWTIGYHESLTFPTLQPDPALCLIHLHRVDYATCWARHRAAAARPWSEEDVRLRHGWQYRIADEQEFRAWYYHGPDLDGHPLERIPERFRALL